MQRGAENTSRQRSSLSRLATRLNVMLHVDKHQKHTELCSLNHVLDDDVLIKDVPRSFFSSTSCHASCVASRTMFGSPRGRRVKSEALGHRRTLGINADES